MKCSRPKCLNRAKRQGLCATHYSLTPSGYVPSKPVIARYKLLRARGLSVCEVARLSGVNRDTLAQMGKWGGGNVRRETAERIMAVKLPTTVQPTDVRISVVGTRRRIQALAAAGHSLHFQAARLGITQQAVTSILRSSTVTARTAGKFKALFDELQMVAGSSNRARNYAARQGWPTAFAWDEDSIDNPDAVADTGVHAPVSASERIEELHDLGVHDIHQIAKRLGVKAESIERQLQRSAA